MVAGSRKDENNFGWDRLVEVMAGFLCVGCSFIGITTTGDAESGQTIFKLVTIEIPVANISPDDDRSGRL
jgi:hypothetical protein